MVALMAGAVQGQDQHIPGKVYVIRLSPMVPDTSVLRELQETYLDPVLRGGEGMFDHVLNNLYRMQVASNGLWFVGYFHPDRQEKEGLLRDSDLLTWLLHGHDVQIMPIELVRSPMRGLLASPARK